MICHRADDKSSVILSLEKDRRVKSWPDESRVLFQGQGFCMSEILDLQPLESIADLVGYWDYDEWDWS